ARSAWRTTSSAAGSDGDDGTAASGFMTADAITTNYFVKTKLVVGVRIRSQRLKLAVIGSADALWDDDADARQPARSSGSSAPPRHGTAVAGAEEESR